MDDFMIKLLFKSLGGTDVTIRSWRDVTIVDQ